MVGTLKIVTSNIQQKKNLSSSLHKVSTTPYRTAPVY